jgi:hypothetical protein
LTTAREQLLTEVTALNDLRGPALAAEIKRVMNNYRVQTKQGVDVTGAPTARDALGDRLAGLIHAGGADLQSKLGAAIDAFRMQTKASAATDRPAGGSRPARPARELPLPVRAEPRSLSGLRSAAPEARP